MQIQAPSLITQSTNKGIIYPSGAVESVLVGPRQRPCKQSRLPVKLMSSLFCQSWWCEQQPSSTISSTLPQLQS